MASSIWWMHNRVTCILRSITEGNTRRLSKLLGRRPGTAASREDLCAPLSQAIRMGQDQCVLSLLSAGADPNGGGDGGRGGAGGGQEDDREEGGKTPLYLVVEAAGGNPEMMRALLKAKAEPDRATWTLKHTPLQLAARRGYQVVVKQLLAAGARPDRPDAAGNTPLMLAAREGHVNIVRALLREGACANSRNLAGDAVSHFAAKGGSVDSLTEVLRAGADPDARDARGQTPLVLACRLRHNGAVPVLLDYDCDVNGQDTVSGKTALHWAIQTGAVNTVTELLAAGADPNVKDRNWTTPFLLALGTSGARDILELLLHTGCDVTVTDRSFNTALHMAASEGQADLLPALVEAGIMVDIKGAGGVTSLMLAAHGGHLATVKLLLQYGASSNLMDRNRASALTYAVLSRSGDDVVFEIVKMLIRSNCELDNCANLKKLVQQLGVNLADCGSVEVEQARLYSPAEVAYLLGKTAIFMMIIKAGATSAGSLADGGAPGLLSPATTTGQPPPESESPNRWYLLHCLRQDQQQIRSLVELCRRPALSFLNRKFKGDSLTMPEKITRLPFPDRVKSFLNYDDLDEVQAKYNVTLRDRQPALKRGGPSGPAGRDSGVDGDRRRGPGTSNGGGSSLRTSFRRSGIGLNRNSAARQSLPIGFSAHRNGGPLASSTPKVVPEKAAGGRHSVSAFRNPLSLVSPGKSQRTGLGVSGTSRVNSLRLGQGPAPVPARSDAHAHANSHRPASATLASRLQRPSSITAYSATNMASEPKTSKTASSNNLELTGNQQLTETVMSPVGNGGLRKAGGTGRVAEYERLENAYDELRTSMLAAGSISDMSSSSNSLLEVRQPKRRGRYGKLDPTQMLLSPPPSVVIDNDSVFSNGELSPQSLFSDDSSMHSGGNKERISASSPTNSKCSTEEADSRQRSILKYNNSYNKTRAHRTPVVSLTSPPRVASNVGRPEWGLKCLRSPTVPNMGPEPRVAPVIMDEQEKKLLEDLMKEVEKNQKKSHIGINPDERPLTPMDEHTKKAIYDKRWARALNPLDKRNTLHSPQSPTVAEDSIRNPRPHTVAGDITFSPLSPPLTDDSPRSPLSSSVSGDTPMSPLSPTISANPPFSPGIPDRVFADQQDGHRTPTIYAEQAFLHNTDSPSMNNPDADAVCSVPHSRSNSSDATMQERLNYNQQVADRSLNELRASMQNLMIPVGGNEKKKMVHFRSSSAKRHTETVHGETNGNVTESLESPAGEDKHLKRWGTMTLDDPEVLDNSENFTSDKSLRSPTGRQSSGVRGRLDSNNAEKGYLDSNSSGKGYSSSDKSQIGYSCSDNAGRRYSSSDDSKKGSSNSDNTRSGYSQSNNTTNNFNNNQSLNPDKPTMRAAVTSLPASYDRTSTPKAGLKSWSLSTHGYGSLNRNQTGRHHNYINDNYRNSNGFPTKCLPPAKNEARQEPASGGIGFKRNSAQYSSMRVRGAYGQRSATCDSPRVKDEVASKGKSAGLGPRDSGHATPAAAPEKGGDGGWAGLGGSTATKGDGVKQPDSVKKPSAGSRIKMAFLHSRSFRR